MTEQPLELPVYVVTGSNFTIEIPMDEYNAQFDTEDQCLEAATRAIEVFKRQRDDFHIVMNADCRDQSPSVGATLLVHLKGTDPEQASVVFTHTCLGNTGYYNDSIVMEAELNRQIAILKAQHEEREKAEKKLAEDLKMFDSLKKDMGAKKKSTKKPRKPKDDGPAY